MEYADELLNILKENNIKIGVISNLSFNGDVLKERLNDAFPTIEFQPVISSADYAIRKPNKLIFEIALRIADCKAEEVLYVGDTYKSDIVGAKNAGMHYLYITDETKEKLNQMKDINDLMELIDYE